MRSVLAHTRSSAVLLHRILGSGLQGALESAQAVSPVVVCARGKGSQASTASSSLIKKLNDEARQEQDYKPDEIVSAGPPKGWTVDEKEGDCHVILSRNTKGETVEISVMASDDAIETIPLDDEEGAEGEEGAEENAIYEIPFTINITKEDGDDGLVFDCVTDGESFTIRKCVVESFEFPSDLPGVDGDEEDEEMDMSGLDEPMEPYRGPIFENLDPELQERFYDYLEERGVTENLVRYVHALVFDKEQREYVRWLGRVKKFLETK